MEPAAGQCWRGCGDTGSPSTAGGNVKCGSCRAIQQVLERCRFIHNVDEMPWELISCLHQLACGKTGFILLHFKLQNLTQTLSEDLQTVVPQKD